MSTVYAVANQKGGVGKTTTTFNVASARAEQGKNVCIIDLDQQGSLSRYAGLKPKTLKETIYDVLKSYAFATKQRPPKPLSSVIRQVRPRLDIVPANGELASLDIEIISATQREYVLRRAIELLKKQYDEIYLDCPPNLGLIVINALAAADLVIIPLQTDYLATQGVTDLLLTVEYVQDRLNPHLAYAGILLTQADERTVHTREIIQKARSDFKDKIRVFNEVVKMSVRVKESPIEAKSVMEYDPDGQPARAYRAMAKELDTNG
jgi:chromosome partitioning protein